MKKRIIRHKQSTDHNKPAGQLLCLRICVIKFREKRSKNKKFLSQIEPLIISMVNTEQFKYNYDTVRDLSIYQFNESVRQVIHKIDYDNRMYGVYTGSISAKDLSQDDFNWLSHK